MLQAELVLMSALAPGIDPVTAKLHEGVEHHRQGRLARARALYERILKEQPSHFDALHLLGVVAAQTNNPERALKLFDRAIAIDPLNADAFCNQGSALKSLKRFDAALQSYDRAIALRPDYAEAHWCRSVVLRELKRWTESLQSCTRAIDLRPLYADAYCNRGKVRSELGQMDAAMADFDRAVALSPDSVEAHNLKGLAFRKLNQHQAAIACLQRALVADPNYVHTYLHLGNVFLDMLRLDDALSNYERAIALKSDFAEARANRAPIFLLRGDFARGWADYEWRWKASGATGERGGTHIPQPRWLGTKPVAGKTVLLIAAQGLGDTLQFCRFASLVAQRGARVIMQVSRPLVELLTTLEGVAAVYADDATLPPFDTYCRVTSLPLVFSTTLVTIPKQIPYLRSSAIKTLLWREKLGEKLKPRVGLVWSSLPRPNEQEGWSVLDHRIIPLAKLVSLRLSGIEFHSLQKGQPAEAELDQLQAAHWVGPALVNFARDLHDLSDTAALIEQLDLVITVDTSIAHLAGAMGKPVWILLCFDSCWRWLSARSDSPWYPTATLYRQDCAGDWDGVVDRVRDDLQNWLQARRFSS